jgi:hypothetical protein
MLFQLTVALLSVFKGGGDDNRLSTPPVFCKLPTEQMFPVLRIDPANTGCRRFCER